LELLPPIEVMPPIIAYAVRKNYESKHAEKCQKLTQSQRAITHANMHAHKHANS
jgi:hypothetical protein